MADKIIVEDEFGVHEFETSSDCVTIIDDGEGNISIVEGDCEDELDYYDCDDCDRCIGYSYCVRDEEEEDY